MTPEAIKGSKVLRSGLLLLASAALLLFAVGIANAQGYSNPSFPTTSPSGSPSGSPGCPDLRGTSEPARLACPTPTSSSPSGNVIVQPGGPIVQNDQGPPDDVGGVRLGEVEEPQARAATALAVTGADLLLFLAIAGITVFVGTLLVRWARRRETGF